MRLSTGDIEIITHNYNLGNFIKIKPIKSGHVNYNFELITSKGKFIIQIIGSKCDQYKMSRMKTEFSVLNYLKFKKFHYKTPDPIEGNNGEYLFQLQKNYLWVYSMIEGNTYSKLNISRFKQAARALAEYHKCIRGLNLDITDSLNLNWLSGKYAEMRKIKSKTKVDLLMINNLPFFESVLTNTNKLDFKIKLVLAHSDFNNGNLLFHNGKIQGIIDFDNIALSPRINDIHLAIRRLNYLKIGYKTRKREIFLQEYEKISKLSNKEKNLIIPSIIRGNCVSFWWIYAEMIKNKNKRYGRLKEIIKETKSLNKKWKSFSNN